MVNIVLRHTFILTAAKIRSINKVPNANFTFLIPKVVFDQYLRKMIKRFLQWRFLVLLFAIAIISGTIIYTRYLAGKIEKEERQRVEEWIQANNVIQQSSESVSISLANLISVN